MNAIVLEDGKRSGEREKIDYELMLTSLFIDQCMGKITQE